MELLREEKLRNSNPVGILQELSGDWRTINRSAMVRCHCCYQVYEHYQTEIFVGQLRSRRKMMQSFELVEISIKSFQN